MVEDKYIPNPVIERAMDVLFILHADHEQNASANTITDVNTNQTGSTIYGNASVDFELHESEQTELVYRILAQAGISIQKPEITQIAAGLEGAKLQQEKK